MFRTRRLRVAVAVIAVAMLAGQAVATALLIHNSREAAMASATDTVERAGRTVTALDADESMVEAARRRLRGQVLRTTCSEE